MPRKGYAKLVADLGDVEKKHAPAVRVEMISGLPKIINQFGLGSSGVLAISASKHSKCTVTPALEVKLLVSSHGFLQTEQFLITIHTRHRPPNPATKKNAPEYPTAGAVVRVYSDQSKRIGPVFSSVEKAQDYLSRR